MGAVFTIVFIAAMLVLGWYVMENDDDHDEWRGW